MSGGDVQRRRRRELVTAAVIVAAVALLPQVMTNVYYQNILILVLLYTALSQSWNLLGGYCGQISLGYALYFGIGAYATVLLYMKADLLPWLGMVAGGGVAAVVALAIGWPCFRMRGHYFSIATIVIAEMGLLAVLNWDWAGAAMGFELPFVPDSWWLLSFGRDKVPYILVALGLAAATWAAAWIMEDSTWGYWWRAVKDNPEAAESLGVSVLRSKLAAAAISAFFTAVGGGFYALFLQHIDPDAVMAFRFSLLMALPAVLGGIGTLWGPMLGAAILVPLDELTRSYSSYLVGSGRGVELITYGGLVMIIALARPDGLIGLVRARRPGVAR